MNSSCHILAHLERDESRLVFCHYAMAVRTDDEIRLLPCVAPLPGPRSALTGLASPPLAAVTLGGIKQSWGEPPAILSVTELVSRLAGHVPLAPLGSVPTPLTVFVYWAAEEPQEFVRSLHKLNRLSPRLPDGAAVTFKYVPLRINFHPGDLVRVRSAFADLVLPRASL